MVGSLGFTLVVFCQIELLVLFVFFVNASQISPINIIVPSIEIMDPSDDMLFHSV